MRLPTPATSARWRKVLLALGVFLLALELVLQVGAAVATWAIARDAGPAGAAVLCIGDSYTYGIGATSAASSYPARLGELLRNRGLDVAVVNGGSPGQDSAFILRRLPSQLAAGTKLVCVMIGTNDGWSHPAAVDADELARATAGDGSARTFEWRWRTGRLLALATRFAFGSWSRTGDAAAATPARRGRDDLRDPATGFAVLESVGVIPSVPELPVLPPACEPRVQARLDEIRRTQARGDGAAALALARVLARDHADCAEAQHALVVTAQQSDDVAAAAALQRLQTMAQAGDPAASEQLALALMTIGNCELALAAAQHRVRQEPRAVFAWNVLQQAAYVLGNWDEFVRAAATSLRLAGRFSPADTAMISRHYARVIAPREPGKAAALLVAATLLDGDDGLARAHMRALAANVPWDEFERVMTTFGSDRAGAMATLRPLLRTLHAGDASNAWAGVLREHLEHIAGLARRHGAKVVLLSYPFFNAELEGTLREAATALAVPFVAVRERFDEELQHRSREQLFVRDGHCSDAGYAIVAALVADAVAPLLAK